MKVETEPVEAEIAYLRLVQRCSSNSVFRASYYCGAWEDLSDCLPLLQSDSGVTRLDLEESGVLAQFADQNLVRT